MNYYAGLDVSMANTSICVENDKGRIVFEGDVPTEPMLIADALAPFLTDLKAVGLESGPISHWLTKQLIENRLPAICIDARVMAAILSTRRNKTDKNDARGIAKAMRCSNYQEVHIKSDEALSIKVLMNSRSILVMECTQLSNAIKGHLKTFGKNRLPGGKNKTFHQKVIEAISKIPKEAQIATHALLGALDKISTEIDGLDRICAQLAKSNEQAQLLMTVPGVGPVAALTYLSEIDDPKRFKKSRSVGAYLGLTPSQYQSGETNRYGHISKCGPQHLRGLLVQGAIVHMTRTKAWSEPKAWAVRLAKKKGVKKAAVALARKHAVIMHRILVTGQPFRYGQKQVEEEQETVQEKKTRAKRAKKIATAPEAKSIDSAPSLNPEQQHVLPSPKIKLGRNIEKKPTPKRGVFGGEDNSSDALDELLTVSST